MTHHAFPMQFFEMSIRPQEDITSFARDCAYYRMRGDIPLAMSLRGGTKRSPSWIHPGGLSSFVDCVPSLLPSLDAVIRNHTRYPLFAAMLSPQKREMLYQYHVDSLSMPFNQISPRMSGPLPGRLAMCPDCYEEDLDNGYAFWHREFLTPGAMVCIKHNKFLLKRCDACDVDSRAVSSNWPISLECACSKKLTTVAELPLAEYVSNHSYMRHVQNYLDGTQPEELTADNVLKAIQHKLSRNRNQQAPAHQLNMALEKRIGSAGINRLKFSAATIDGISGSRRKIKPARNPLQLLTAFDAVFENIEDFQMTLREADEMSETNAPSRGNRWRQLTKQEIDHQTHESRKWLKSALRKNPSISRSRLLRIPGAGRHLYHLYHHDAAWYAMQLPPAAQLGKRPPNNLEELVTQMVCHISSRYELGMEIWPPMRVTKRFLTEGTTNKKSVSVMTSPEVINTLSQCIESDAEWQERRIQEVCKFVATKRPDSPYANPETYRGLQGAALANRIFYARHGAR
ncbi:TniQ family protein [Herbaspirillum camelliae]|uniref:TniQ family protein n=1 Tax=Herbaspirillum camelliae TaxID=1892903 RepID=UPI000B0F9883|nr:hypothetical protein [Herbaspirillum camelliae]